MSKRYILRLVTDTALLVLYVLLICERITGELAHEAVGLVLFAIVITHNILNYKWYRSLVNGRYGAVRIVTTVVDFLLLIFLFLLAVSAIMISQEILFALNFGNYFDGRLIHTFAAYWGLIFIGLHLGLHWRMALGGFRKIAKVNDSVVRVWVLRAVAVVLCGFGIYAFIALDACGKLFMLTTYSVSTEWFILLPEVFGIVALFAVIGHYLSSILVKCRIKNRSE